MAEEFDHDQFRMRFLDAMTQAKIGTRDLAALTDTNRAAIKRWKNGKAVPNTESIYRICNATGLSADWLLGLRS